MTEHKHNEHCNHNHDGVDNKEHFLDMFAQAEMLMQNIKDNTDGAFDLLKVFNADDDIADVVKIDASEILEIEKLTTPIFDEINKIKNLIKNSENYLINKENIEKYFNFIQTNEEKSSNLFNNLIKKIGK